MADDPPELDKLIEDAGRRRLAAYYVYSALLAGVTSGTGLAPARWSPELAKPVQRLGLAQFAPRTGRGLDAQLNPVERAARRNPGRYFDFAQLLVDLINQGAFGPLCGDADRVRLSGRGDGHRLDLELIKGWRVVGACPVEDHWELVAQHLAGLLHSGALHETPLAGNVRGSGQTTARQLKDSGLAHTVSLDLTLAVHLHPLGAIADLDTRLIRSRVRAELDEADALRLLCQELRTLRSQAERELADLWTGRST